MSRITTWWDGEKGRQFLWVPVLFAAGIAVYFALPVEPDPLPPLYVAAAVLLGRGLMPYRRFKAAFLVLGLLFAGMAWAAFHTTLQSPMVITKPLTPRPISGTIADIERVEKGMRFTLRQLAIAGVDEKETPEQVRISVRVKAGTSPALPHIGERMNIMAGLLPPMGPAMPGGFDFARYFFFRDIGAVGYGLPPWKTESAPESSFAQWRFALTEKIIAQLGTERGPIAAGLITGEDRAITENDFKALRASNLYHIIAISGGHMVVIAGVVFLALRWLLLCIPNAGQRPQMKSIAAGGTLLVITGYLFVTGMPVSAVRAYIMVALVLLAVLLRREVDAMRSLLLAALLMLLFDPSDLLEPGFMLSFAATLAIIALVETTWLRPGSREERPFIHTALRVLLTMFLISVVAEAATAPLVLSMFNTASPYGVLANMLATPLVTFVLMPTVALFFLLLPLGLEHWALEFMDIGIVLLMHIARWIAALPNAQMFAPSLPGWGVALFVGGLLWLCLVQQRVRMAGFAVMAIGIASIVTVRLPDILVGPELKQIALRTDDGYKLVRGRANSLLPELWANGLGYETLPVLKPGTETWRCDSLGCIAKVEFIHVAFPNSAEAAVQDCSQTELMFTLQDAFCESTQITGRWALRYGGVHAVWVEEEGEGWPTTIETSADWQGRRPWSAYARPKASWSR